MQALPSEASSPSGREAPTKERTKQVVRATGGDRREWGWGPRQAEGRERLTAQRSEARPTSQREQPAGRPRGRMSAVRSEPAKSQCDPEESRGGAGDPASVALGGPGGRPVAICWLSTAGNRKCPGVGWVTGLQPWQAVATAAVSF